MNSAARKGVYSRRYAWTKFGVALEEAYAQLVSGRGAQQQSTSEVWSSAIAKFKETYNKELTTVMLFTGAAMVPTLNARAVKDRFAIDKLVVRLIPRPSARTVHIGDVVAFNSPLSHSGTHVMVRRIAAMEHQELISDCPSDDPLVIPEGHFWVLADNPDVQPPDVVDSRTLGFVPLTNIIGRIIYQVQSRNNHGRVHNSVEADMVDTPVVEQEVDVDELAGEAGERQSEEET